MSQGTGEREIQKEGRFVAINVDALLERVRRRTMLCCIVQARVARKMRLAQQKQGNLQLRSKVITRPTDVGTGQFHGS